MRGGIGFGIALVIGVTLFAAPHGEAQAPAAQPPAQLTQAQQDAAAIVGTMGKNTKALTTYTYQQRVQMAYDGEVKSTTLNQISFDASGKPVVLQLSQTTPDTSERRLGHRVADSKKEEIGDDVKALMQLAPGYLFPNQAQMQKLAQSTAVSYKDSTINLTASDFVQAGDAMTITAKNSNMTRMSAKVTTAVDKDPVTITAGYGNMKDGLNYLMHYVISCPNEKIVLTIDTLNYTPAK